MRNLLPGLLALLMVSAPFVETTHDHGDGHEAPCPAVCLGSSAGTYCCHPDPVRYAAPAETVSPVSFRSEPPLISRLIEDEIFHPPAR